MEWVDNFDGPAGAPGPWWHADIGYGLWGDPAQLQRYTSPGVNAALDGGGHLVVTARREATAIDGGRPDVEITSARLTTLGSVHFRYGMAEARLKVPGGVGLWAAFWMLGTDMDEVGWPACGEIDVMEHVGSEPSTVHGTVHLPGHAGLPLSGGPPAGIGTSFDSGHDLTSGFHDYAVSWEPDTITWLLDGQPYATLGRGDVPGGIWPFDHDHHLLLNLAVGGSWPGNVSSDPVLPASLVVDRVRVDSDHLTVLAPG